jgi:hypothetical protein
MFKRLFVFFFFFVLAGNVIASNGFAINGRFFTFDAPISSYGLSSISLKDPMKTFGKSIDSLAENYFEAGFKAKGKPLELFWNIQAYRNDDFSMVSYDWNWFQMRHFVFQKKGTEFTFGKQQHKIKIGDSSLQVYNSIGDGRTYFDDDTSNEEASAYPPLFPKFDQNEHGLPTILLYYDENKNLKKVVINYYVKRIKANENIDGNLFKKWFFMGASASAPEIYIEPKKDGTFKMRIPMAVEGAFMKVDATGNWKLLLGWGCPILSLKTTKLHIVGDKDADSYEQPDDSSDGGILKLPIYRFNNGVYGMRLDMEGSSSVFFFNPALEIPKGLKSADQQ